MAAGIIANELGLDIFKIDLSAVVSKWIGQTEKNIEVIFKEAQTSNSILFFESWFA
jgi:SpoVK/Ycf46/Vps4 family AAA+-type ATPase